MQMTVPLEPHLNPKQTSGAQVLRLENGGWHLEIPSGRQGRYRLAQLDDYKGLSRGEFPWRPPLTLSLQAQASAANLAGTWGFGFWNDPFSASLGFGGGSRRIPALPHAVWFFFASPPNHLSLRDDRPADGFLTAAFRSPLIPAPILALGLPALPLLFWPPTARWLRSLGRRLVQQDSASLSLNPTRWHTYVLSWETDGVAFKVDGDVVFESPITPRGPLGLVLWVDNQYAAFPPDGRLGYGFLTTPEPAWLKVADVVIEAVAPTSGMRHA
jgi:hypothetical protein